MRTKWYKCLTLLLVLGLLYPCLPIIPIMAGPAPQSVQAEINTLINGNAAPQIGYLQSSSGLQHPGIGLTRDVIARIQTKIRSGQDPWASYFLGMSKSSVANPDYMPRIDQNRDGAPDFTEITTSNQWEHIAGSDAHAAYTLSLMFVVTGNNVYRAKAMEILRLWSQTEQVPGLREHIKSGYPVYYFNSAAELMKYSSTTNTTLKWTASDNSSFSNFVYSSLLYNNMKREFYNSQTNTFSKLELENGYWMNQHGYSILAALTTYLFLDDASGYGKAVELVTKNGSFQPNWRSGSISMQAREVAPGKYQLAEMGRDQTHAMANISTLSLMCQMIFQQGTKVDPITGMTSTGGNAVHAFEFMGSRLLYAADYMMQYNLGYSPEWLPLQAEQGNSGSLNYRQMYNYPSDQGRGQIWDIGLLYHFYKYSANQTINLNLNTPYLVEYYKQRRQPSSADAWIKDAGFWPYIPEAADNDEYNNVYSLIYNHSYPINAAEIREIDRFYHAFDKSKTATMTSGNERFVELTSDADGTAIAMLESSFRGYRQSRSVITVRFRTNGEAVLGLKSDSNGVAFTSVKLPNTNNQWKFVDMDISESVIPFVKYREDINLLYFEAVGNGTKVGLDYLAINRADTSVPRFEDKQKVIHTYVGGNVSAALAAINGSGASYSLLGAPSGVTVDANGQLSWSTPAVGAHKFHIVAEKNHSIAVLPVSILVSNNLNQAVLQITSGYDASKKYVLSSLEAYQSIRGQAMGVINNSSSNTAQIAAALVNLKNAVDGLELLTPALTDTLPGGAMLTTLDYSNMVTSTLSSGTIKNLVDGDPDSFTGDLFRHSGNYFILDFGKDFKVKASAFWIRNRIYFPLRSDYTVVYGSNNMVDWEKLTDDNAIRYTNALQDTGKLEDMHRTEVFPAYRNTAYRFLKVTNNSNLFSISEFRIEGERVQPPSAISSVSLSSGNGEFRAGEGDQVVVNFKATGANVLRDLHVKIEGHTVSPVTSNGVDYTASWTVPSVGSGVPREATFEINYKIANVAETPSTIYMVTDDSHVYISSDANQLDFTGAGLIDSTPTRPANATAAAAASLFDGNPSTFSDFRLNGGGWGGFITFDLGDGSQTTISGVDLLARQDQFYTRIGGTVIQGSNDNASWVNLTNAATSSNKWQRLNVTASGAYRFIRIYNGGNWFGNVAEVRFHGQATHDLIETVSIGSVQSVKNRIATGDTVQVTFKSKQAIQDVQVSIQGQAATVSSSDNLHWMGTAVMPAGAAEGNVQFAIQYRKANGVAGTPVAQTTDNSGLFLVSHANYMGNLLQAADLIDSNPGRSANDTLTQVNYLLDGAPGTNADFRVNQNGSSSGWGGFITFDFREGHRAIITRVEILARQDGYYGRIAGAVVQGSNDNQSWVNLVGPAISTTEWQSFAVVNPAAYRYIRVYNPGNWFGNLAELRMHGSVRTPTSGSAVDLVSLSAATGDYRAVEGDQVKLNFRAASGNLISDVKVRIEGNEVAPATSNGVDYSATWTVPSSGSSSNARLAQFELEYRDLQVSGAPITVNSVTDNSHVYISSDANRLGFAGAELIDSTPTRPANATAAAAAALFDGNPTTFSDFRVNGGGWGGFIIFDLGDGSQATISSVELLARQDQYYTRIGGTVIQGSNDNANWVNLTNAATSSNKWQRLNATSSGAYRYIRIYNGGNWFGNVSEVRFHGQATHNLIETVSIGSAQSVKNRIATGDTVQVTFKSKQAIQDVQVSIQGQAATVSSSDNLHWTGTAVMPAGAAEGNVQFAIQYRKANGAAGTPVAQTTDNSGLFLVSHANYMGNLLQAADLIDSNPGRTATDTLTQVNYLLDGAPGTNSDFRVNQSGSLSGWGGFITFDFKEGHRAIITRVEMLARQDGYFERIAGAVLQGSNDNQSWVNLAGPAVSTTEWQSFAMVNPAAYRYIRVYNPGNWFGNLAELRLHGSVV